MKVIAINPEEAKVLGHRAATVLAQIRYWLYKAKDGASRYVVEKFGDRWLAHSREQLGQETGLTPSQMRHAIERLKQHGFIAVGQHLYQGKNVSHFRAAEEGQLAEKGPIKMAQNDPPELDSDSHLGLASTDQLIKGENNIETMKDLGAPNAPTSSGKKKEESNSGEKGGEGPTHHDEVTPSKLSEIFRDAWDETYSGSFLPAFDGKEMGQFKNLVQRCPDGLAAAIVDYSVRQWHAFCSYACSTEAAFNLPNMPHLGTLLRFVQSAANLYLDQREALAKAAQKPRSNYVPPQPASVIKKPSEKATLEEVAAFMGKKLN